ncbi:ribosomal protein 63, mitochondrial [Ischnura elegans]|uniref:ribosomal protein 63, mitochondrial n=1 Tax=Ischnura elegans TaxID=197161 RepID=UPI001ED8B494|nr:ribosomal protein 63, mitochondrial [Ischnura elegans]XP_046385695.1 ribosomal protein 63, mitochondrial [Ischnura elegans]XP_046385696.1 ribosomal protein 63, mitochondrial [Ischnura elegans]
MRLSLILLRKKMPPGNIFTGKHRLVKIVTKEDMAKARNDYAIEERNMLYLRNPYLSEEQSFGHAKALGKHEQWIRDWRVKRQKRKENVSICDHLSHLSVKEAWE